MHLSVIATPGLLGLIVFFAVGNFFVGQAAVLITPLVLSFSTPVVLGRVLAAGGLGVLAGSLTMSLWGGGKRRIRTVFVFFGLLGVAVLAAGAYPSVILVAAGVFAAYFVFPIYLGASQAILRTKVPADLQGRVFSLRITLATAAFALAYLTAGPLAEQLFEPLLARGGPLAGSIGLFIGVGPGRGIGLLLMLMGGLVILTALIGACYPRLRRIEEELPDAA